MWARSAALLSLLLFSASPAAAECPPMERVIDDVVATEPRARADVTERFACYFPAGLGFNDAALLLEANGFDLLNGVEPLFHLWRGPGEEFVSRRVVRNGRSLVEIRMVLHMRDKRITQFAAQYFLDQR